MPRASTPIYRPTPFNLRRLAGLLKRGGLVAVPTETVYGLAADAFDPAACRRIFKAKRRPTTDPLIVHIADYAALFELGEINSLVERLAHEFWPGPLTLLLKKSPRVPDIVTAGLESVAVRLPAHPLFRRLIRLVGSPLAAPSANPFGYVSPTNASHVRAGLDGRIDAILDGGPCRIGVESTIVDARNPERPKLLRPGGITRKRLEAFLGKPLRSSTRTVSEDERAEAPGQLARHYSPTTPITLVHRATADEIARLPENEAFVSYKPRKHPADAPPGHRYVLSENASGKSAANSLFALLRRLDEQRYCRLHIELAPTRDTWSEAINDRLRRAAAKV